MAEVHKEVGRGATDRLVAEHEDHDPISAEMHAGVEAFLSGSRAGRSELRDAC